MKQTILILALALAGCGGGNDASNPEACNTRHLIPDTVTASGVSIAYTDQAFTFADSVEQAYKDAEACAGMQAKGPPLKYFNFAAQGFTGSWSVYYFPDGAVWVNTDPSLNRNCHSDMEALKHEFVHHLLKMNGVNDTDNINHNHPAFSCAPGVRTENGTPY